MNIAFDAKRAFHNHRGLGNYSRSTIDLLSQFAPENNYFLFNPSAKGNIPFELSSNTKIIYPETLLDKISPAYWRSKNCTKQIKSLEIDIYHGLSQEFPQGIDKIPVKKVVTIHDAIFIRYPELYDSLYCKIFTKKNLYSCAIADKIIAISEQTKQDCIDFFGADPNKIDVVYQGCKNIFRKNISDEEVMSVKATYNLPANYLLNVGAIEKRKNIKTIIEALHIRNIDIPLVVIGNRTKYLEELKMLVHKYNMESQVIFLYNTNTEDLPAIYKGASIFLYPSIFEGFGIPILEALCTSTPVITSKGSCFRETGGESTCYVDYNNAEEMAESIDMILSDIELQKNMMITGLAHANNFTDEKVARNLLRVYNSLQ